MESEIVGGRTGFRPRSCGALVASVVDRERVAWSVAVVVPPGGDLVARPRSSGCPPASIPGAPAVAEPIVAETVGGGGCRRRSNRVSLVPAVGTSHVDSMSSRDRVVIPCDGLRTRGREQRGAAALVGRRRPGARPEEGAWRPRQLDNGKWGAGLEGPRVAEPPQKRPAARNPDPCDRQNRPALDHDPHGGRRQNRHHHRGREKFRPAAQLMRPAPGLARGGAQLPPRVRGRVVEGRAMG